MRQEGEKREPCPTPDRAAAVTCPLPTQDQAKPEAARVTWGKEHPGFGWSLCAPLGGLQRHSSHALRDQNLTCGGVFTSSATVNVSIGLLFL